MNVVLGFDPGGKGAFGWAVAEFDSFLPLRLRGSGDADHAQAAVSEAQACLKPSDSVVAAGIDSPMYWTPTGDRVADRTVREGMRRLGAPASQGTVQHVNSLRGACVVQGMTCGILLRQEYGELQISEAHPKALLWLLGIAKTGRPPSGVLVPDLAGLIDGSPASASEHERDAGVGLLSGWAMNASAPGWVDLLTLEGPNLLPLGGPLGYWMPMEAGG